MSKSDYQSISYGLGSATGQAAALIAGGAGARFLAEGLVATATRPMQAVGSYLVDYSTYLEEGMPLQAVPEVGATSRFGPFRPWMVEPAFISSVSAYQGYQHYGWRGALIGGLNLGVSGVISTVGSRYISNIGGKMALRIGLTTAGLSSQDKMLTGSLTTRDVAENFEAGEHEVAVGTLANGGRISSLGETHSTFFSATKDVGRTALVDEGLDYFKEFVHTLRKGL